MSTSEDYHSLAHSKWDCKILEGHLMADYVHMLVEVPPKYAVSSVIGFLKGKSAIAIAREFGSTSESRKPMRPQRQVAHSN